MNNRPIRVDYEEDREEVLTPNHLVFGRRLENRNESVSDELNIEEGLSKRKKFVAVLLNHF